MIVMFVVSVVVAVLAYRMASRLAFGYRIIIATIIFIALNAPNIIVIITGDQAPEDARIITQEELKNSADSQH